MKVALVVKARTGWHNPDLPLPVPIRESLPYFVAQKGRYVHRVKSASLHFCITAHISVTFWCGGGSSVSDRKGGQFFDGQSDCDLPYCATCEGRAIGAGLDGSRVIAGREVMFNPQKSPRSESQA